MSLQRILAPFVDVRKEEAFTAVLMFVYSFLAMTAYNIIQPLDAIEGDPESGCGERAVGHPRIGTDHQPADAGLHPHRQHAAAALGAADHAGGDGGRDARILVPVQDRRGLGLGGVLRVGRAPRDLADQPVLDARERDLRPAPGQTRVRLRRRRCDARRHDRFGADRADHRRSRHQRAAAVERRHAADLRRDRRHDSRPGAEAGHPGRQGRTGRDHGAGDASCCAAPARSRSSRWSSASAPSARPCSISRSTWRPRCSRAPDERFDRRVSGADPLLHLGRGLRHPGVDHAEHPPLSRHRVRPADPPDESVDHRGDHPAEQRALGPGAGAGHRPVVQVYGRQDDPRSAVPAAAVRAPAGSQTVRRRDGGPHGESRRRAADPGADPAMGIRARAGTS